MLTLFTRLTISYSPYIVKLNAPRYRDLVLNRKDAEVWHVLFIGNYQDPKEEVEKLCQNAIEQQEKAANETHKICKFGIVNITEEPFLAQRNQLRYLPYVKIYHTTGIEDYTGAHKSQAYIDAISNRLPNYVRTFDRKNIDESIPNIVLFTDQIRSPTLWTSLSLEYKDSFVKFSLCSDFYTHKQFNIARLPTVMFFNSTTQIRYRGDLTEAELKKAIDQFLNRTYQIGDEMDDEGFYRQAEFKEQCFSRDYCIVSTWANISDVYRDVRQSCKHHPMKFFYGAEDLPIHSMEQNKFYIWKPRGHGLIKIDSIDELATTIDRVIDGGARFTKVSDDDLEL